MQTQIPVFYRPEMTAASRFFAPGTFKPATCVEDYHRASSPDRWLRQAHRHP